MSSVRIHPEAAEEAEEAAAWYEGQQADLGRDFLEELKRALSALGEFPLMWPLWPDVDLPLAVRRALLSRFPYGIAYLSDDEEVFIVAVAHLSRLPGYWKNRLTP